MNKQTNDIKPIDGRCNGDMLPYNFIKDVEPLAIQVIKEGGEGVDQAVEWLVSVHYQSAMRATGKYLRHLEFGIIDGEMNYCALKTAIKYDPKVGPFVGYYIGTLKNRLYDMAFKNIGKTKKQIKNLDILVMAEKQIEDIFDHSKIILLKKRKNYDDDWGTRKTVSFYKSDLDVLEEEEKNLLALVSQIWCTNKVIAQRMEISESKVSMLWQRINRKLYPIYKKRRAEQFDWTWGCSYDDTQSAVKTSAEAVEQYRSDTFDEDEDGNIPGGWSIEKAYFAGLDDDKDFNTSIYIQDRETRKILNQAEPPKK